MLFASPQITAALPHSLPNQYMSYVYYREKKVFWTFRGDRDN